MRVDLAVAGHTNVLASMKQRTKHRKQPPLLQYVRPIVAVNVLGSPPVYVI